MEFKKHKLGEFIDSISDTTPILKEKVILINTSDVENGETLNHKYVENKNLKGQFKKRFKKGDILYSEIRPKNKRFAYIDFDSNDYIASTKLMVLRNNGNIDNDFLFQILKSDTVIDYLQMIAESRSGTFPQITFNELSNVEIYIPDIEIQKKISNFLQKIDKKIKLNNQINDNLFEILKQYIKENYYNNCSIEVKALSNIGRIQGGYAFKSKDLLDESTKNKIFKIKNISSNGIDIENTQCIYDEIANKIDKKFLLTQGNVIIAMTGAELGKTGYMYGNEYRYFLNQRVGVIRGNDIFSELYLNCIFLQDDMQNILNSKGYGSAQPNISTTDIENIEIPIPNENELKEFYEVCNPIYNKLILNSEQNQYLMQLRDTLLPKLMNGEIDLDKVEI